VLVMFFGDNVHDGVTSSRFGNETGFFDHFSTALAEIIEACIWAGLHFRAADVQSVAVRRPPSNGPQHTCYWKSGLP
jgi:hypothetical protein